MNQMAQNISDLWQKLKKRFSSKKKAELEHQIELGRQESEGPIHQSETEE